MYTLLFAKMKLSGRIFLEAEKLKKPMVIEGIEYEDWSEQEVRNIIFNGSTIKHCELDSVFFTELGLNNSKFSYTGFDRAEFAEVGMHDASFTMVGITNAKFNSGTIYGSTFDGTFANNVRFNQVQLENTVIRESNLSEA